MLNLEIIAACFENRMKLAHQWPFTRLGDADSIPHQFVWAGWWAKWHWHNFLSELLLSPVSIIPTFCHHRRHINSVISSIQQQHIYNTYETSSIINGFDC